MAEPGNLFSSTFKPYHHGKVIQHFRSQTMWTMSILFLYAYMLMGPSFTEMMKILFGPLAVPLVSKAASKTS
jgi:hypothetical protein